MANRTSCIEHPAKQIIVMIREDYLAVCGGDDCAAVLLNYFEHWTNSKLDAQEQWKRQCAIAEKTGEPLPPAPDVWTYASQDEIQDDLLRTFGEKKIGSALEWLVDVGFLMSRNNPKHAWDRTKQYQLDVAFVQLAIRENAEWIGVEMRDRTPQKRDIEGGENAGALPKTSPKPISKPTSKGLSSDAQSILTAFYEVQKGYTAEREDYYLEDAEWLGANCTPADIKAFVTFKRKDKFWAMQIMKLQYVRQNITVWLEANKPPVRPAAQTPAPLPPVPTLTSDQLAARKAQGQAVRKQLAIGGNHDSK